MTTSKIKQDEEKTIAYENRKLRHGEVSNNTHNREADDAGDTTVPNHGPETIAEGNQELRDDESSGNSV